jgi:hypothetical protein
MSYTFAACRVHDRACDDLDRFDNAMRRLASPLLRHARSAVASSILDLRLLAHASSYGSTSHTTSSTLPPDPWVVVWMQDEASMTWPARRVRSLSTFAVLSMTIPP